MCNDIDILVAFLSLPIIERKATRISISLLLDVVFTFPPEYTSSKHLEKIRKVEEKVSYGCPKIIQLQCKPRCSSECCPLCSRLVHIGCDVHDGELDGKTYSGHREGLVVRWRYQLGLLGVVASVFAKESIVDRKTFTDGKKHSKEEKLSTKQITTVQYQYL